MDYLSFLKLIEKEANQRLSEADLLPIHLSNTYGHHFNIVDLQELAVSTNSNFYKIYNSFQPKIKCYISHEISTCFYDNKANFLKMFEVLEKDVNQFLQQNQTGDLNSYTLIKKTIFASNCSSSEGSC